MVTTTSTPTPTTTTSAAAAQRRKHRGLLLMLVPCIVFFVVFHYLPMYGIVIAFKQFSMKWGILGSPWNGLENFHRLFGSQDFLNVFKNTIVISLLRMTFGFFAPIALALLLNEVRVSWYKRTIQTFTYLPFFLSWVILGGIFLMLFSQSGPINQLLMGMHLPGKEATVGPINFLTDGKWFIAVLIATGIWQGAGYGAVIYLAALSGIDPTLYEAAMVDGANRWKQTLHITLPCLVPTIVTLFILNAGQILNAGFDQIYNMYNPMVYNTSDIIDTYVLNRMVNMDYSLATAAGLFKSVIGMMMIVLVNNIAKRTSGGEQGVW